MREETKLWIALSGLFALQIFIMYNEYCIFTRMILINRIFIGG